MQRRRLDDAALPGVRDGLDAVFARERRDPEQLGDAAAARHVGLHEVDVPALDQLAEAPDRRVLLAGRDADVDGVGELGVRLVLVRARTAPRARRRRAARARGRRRIAVFGVGAVAEAGVDQDRRRPRRPPRRRPARARGRASASAPSGPQPSFTAVKPWSRSGPDALAHLAGRVGHQHRCVRADAVAPRRPEQLADRLAERLALDVPERDVDAADRVQRDARGGRCRSGRGTSSARAARRRAGPRRPAGRGGCSRSRASRARRSRARTASGAESTSPTPTMPSSVWTRTTRSSWLPSAMPSSSTGWRRMIASTSVIFTVPPRVQGHASLAPSIVNYNQIVYNRRLGGDSPVHCTLDLDAPGQARRPARAAALEQHERLVAPLRPDRLDQRRRRPDRGRLRRRARRRARGPGRGAPPRPRDPSRRTCAGS